jgi:hypothetical protein
MKRVSIIAAAGGAVIGMQLWAGTLPLGAAPAAWAEYSNGSFFLGRRLIPIGCAADLRPWLAAKTNCRRELSPSPEQ